MLGILPPVKGQYIFAPASGHVTGMKKQERTAWKLHGWAPKHKAPYWGNAKQERAAKMFHLGQVIGTAKPSEWKLHTP